jgi:carboxyl-terminal processing protease
MAKNPLTHATLAALLLVTAACGLVRRPPPTATPVPTTAATQRHLAVFEAAWTAVRDQYVNADFGGGDWEAVGAEYRARIEAGVSEDEFVQAIEAMLGTLPANQAIYQTRAERLEEETTDPTVYHGVGAFIAFREMPQPHVVILAVMGDSPAERAGLEPHDSIYAVDGVPFTLEDAETPAERIRGLPDSSVTLTVQSPGRRPRDITIAREEIRTNDVLRGGHLTALNVAYYRVPVLAGSTLPQTIGNDLASIATEDALNGIVLDLRVARSGNGGWPLGEMLALFGDGDLGEFYTRTTTETVTIAGQNLGGSQTLPLLVLVGPDTEGTPEIFAAALQGAGRALVVGLATPGAVEGFDEIALPDGSRLFLATSSFRTPTNDTLAERGLVPDVTVDADWDSFANADDPVIEAALAMIMENPPN